MVTNNTAPQAPRYMPQPYSPSTRTGWPLKAQQGNSIRAYCWQVASKLHKASGGQGFTLAAYASALAANAKGSSYKQPSTGWGTPSKPNGAAFAHANWFAGAKQQWLVLVPTKAPKARKPRASKPKGQGQQPAPTGQQQAPTGQQQAPTGQQ